MSKYPDEFIERVKAEYGDGEIVRRLRADDDFAGRYLDDSSGGGISVAEVLAAQSIEALHQKARRLKNRRELYEEWSRIYRKAKGLDS